MQSQVKISLRFYHVITNSNSSITMNSCTSQNMPEDTKSCTQNALIIVFCYYLCTLSDFLSHRRVHVCNNREKKIFFKDSNFNSSICNISTCNSCCRTLLLRTDIITSLDYVREELTNQSYSCFPVVNWEDCVDYVNFCIILAPYYF